MPQVTVYTAYRVNGIPVEFTHVYDGEGLIDLAVPVVHGATNLQIELQFLRSKLNCLQMSASKALEVYTNAASTGSPADHISIPAGGAWEWNDQKGIPLTAILGADVQSIFVTNAGGTASFDTILYIRGIKDATPGT